MTTLTPGDDSDFGGNDWFECPVCEDNLKIYWFLQDDESTCNGCDSTITITAEVEHPDQLDYEHFPGAEEIGKFGYTGSGSKVHIIRTGQTQTICGKDDIAEPPEELPEMDEICKSCIYISETGSHGQGMTKDKRRGVRGNFKGKLRKARDRVSQ